MKEKRDGAKALARNIVKTVRWQRVYIRKLKKIGCSNREIAIAVCLPEDHPAITGRP